MTYAIAIKKLAIATGASLTVGGENVMHSTLYCLAAPVQAPPIEEHETSTNKTKEKKMETIGKTADGAVVVNRHNTHLHDEVRPIIVEALSRVTTLQRAFVEAEVDFGRIIGMSCCVGTTETDCVVFAQRPHRKGLTRFVLDKDKEPTTKAMVVLKRSEKPSVYVLITAFLGGKAELEPWDPRATPASLRFWQEKALVWGEPIVRGTATMRSPW